MDLGELPDHARGHESHGPIETLLQEHGRRCPAFIHKPIKHSAREGGPDVLATFPPILLQIGAKLRVPEPEDAEVGLVLEGVLGQPDAVEPFGVEPVHIRMSIVWVTRPPIDFMPINRPKVGHNIEIMLGNIPASVCVVDPGDKV
jgi:hypothetical protein